MDHTAHWSAAQLIAHVAPGLSDAELRAFVHLAAIAEASGDNTFSISSRELSRLTGQSRSTVQQITASMRNRQVIIVDRAGTTKASTRWRIAALELQPIGAPPVEPPRPVDANLSLFEGQRGGPPAGPPLWESLLEVDRQPSHVDRQTAQVGGPATGPGGPPTGPGGGPRAGPGGVNFQHDPPPPSRARVEIEFDNTIQEILDRVMQAKPKEHDSKTLTEMTRWLWAYRRKYSDPPEPDIHPPDAGVVAQFLAITELPRLQALLYDLMTDKVVPGYSWGWFITVGLQRIHGIKAHTVKQRRRQLHLLRTKQRARIADSGSAELLQGAVDATRMGRR